VAGILLIDDDESGRALAVFNLRREGHVVTEAKDGRAGLALYDPEQHDLVVTDVRMPHMSGMEVLQGVRARSSVTKVLIITAFGSVEGAVEFMKEGAYDFILKPFNRDQLLLTVNKALKSLELERENVLLKRKLSGIERPIIYQSELMAKTIAVADRVAASNASVLISGESGTGKELVARRMHARSPRVDEPFVPVNCAAIPEELLEAELFGHTKGAFTGASKARVGRFRQADAGTIFLDEVGELPLSVQAKLLRVLQEQSVDVVGADAPTAIDVRVIAATNRDLLAEVQAKRFRADLYFRLNVIEIEVPPLRHRKEDVRPLTEFFTQHLATDREFTVPDEVIAELERRPWPGNVRELRNACERMVILCTRDILSVDDLPQARTEGEPTGTEGVSGEVKISFPPNGVSLLDVEKRVIEHVLNLKGHNVSEAARYLKVPRHILAYRIEKYGIETQGVDK